MDKKIFLPALLALCLGCVSVSEDPGRVVESADDGWEFRLETEDQWRAVRVPHDWGIEYAFKKESPAGAGGGALDGGVGLYRRRFELSPEDGQHYFIRFDGVYMNSTVSLNGHVLGNRPYGYATFEYDMTPYLADGENMLEVRVENAPQPNSRWYSGSGIYRHVWLVRTGDVHAVSDGIRAMPVLNGDGSADVDFEVCMVDEKSGKTWTETRSRHIGKPRLWTLEDPYVYNDMLRVDGKDYPVSYGIRDIRFDDSLGFFLNGKNIKIRGVCEHHDLGCLGSAFNEDAMHRKLVMLKGMGVNAIRTSHNPPAPQLLDMCDTMGIMVMDEAFDVWRKRKTPYDYALHFNEWYEKDLSDMVRRDRNHPSIILWSIGNEVLEQWTHAEADTLSLAEANLLLNFGHSANEAGDSLHVNALLARKLASIVRDLDPSRPITAGCNGPEPKNHLFGAVDVIGYNYHDEWIPSVPSNFPGRPFIMTETVSAIQTRGHYIMPSDEMHVWPSRWDLPFDGKDYLCSSYDNNHVPWGTTHEHNLSVVENTPFVSGQFIWTGFDYIGEPTPYDFPAHSSYFGIIDLAGFPKDSYWLYKSVWTDEPVLHVFPHWNWETGQKVDVWAYYNNADEVELFVNGESAGVRRKADGEYHVSWTVDFVPGEIRAVSRKDGDEVLSELVRTAGEPASLRLIPRRFGNDLVFVEVDVVDENGVLCPWDMSMIEFNVTDGEIVGVDNGAQACLESFRPDPSDSTHAMRSAFYGKCLVVVRPEAGCHLTAAFGDDKVSEAEL